MPNWCENDLTVHGPANEINRMLEFVSNKAGEDGKETVFDFNKITPYPEKFVEMDKRYREFGIRCNAIFSAYGEGQESERNQRLEALLQEFGAQPGEHFTDGYNSGGYQWCNANWGTKWNACGATLEERDQNDDEVILHFDTAWAPPIPVIEKLAAIFPGLDFCHEYYEQGMAICGSARYSAGKCERSTQGEYYGMRGG